MLAIAPWGGRDLPSVLQHLSAGRAGTLTTDFGGKSTAASPAAYRKRQHNVREAWAAARMSSSLSEPPPTPQKSATRSPDRTEVNPSRPRKTGCSPSRTRHTPLEERAIK
mmetsp:Transcript_20448/g.66034  ORF Transcript_20448/g.66034 Transcript_20448/m.66034 type:complete len:110 (-) Transcript_20448:2952-3281(-)